MADAFDSKVFFSPFLYGGVTSSTIKIFDRIDWLLQMAGAKIDSEKFYQNTLKYKKAVKLQKENTLSDEHQIINFFSEINSILTPNTLPGVRDCNSYVLRNNTRYYFDNIASMDKKIYQIAYKYANVSSLDDAIYFYTEFINLHPFRDGNGRTSRFLLEFALEKAGIDSINPHLYFLTGRDEFVDNGKIVMENVFRSVEWGISKKNIINSKLAEFNKLMANRSLLDASNAFFTKRIDFIRKPFFLIGESTDKFVSFFISNKEVELTHNKKNRLAYYKADSAVNHLKLIDSTVFNMDIS